MDYSPKVKAVLAILQDEANGDVHAALAKLTKDYQMTWVYKSKDELFPKTGDDIHAELEVVYPIKGR